MFGLMKVQNNEPTPTISCLTYEEYLEVIVKRLVVLICNALILRQHIAINVLFYLFSLLIQLIIL